MTLDYNLDVLYSKDKKLIDEYYSLEKYEESIRKAIEEDLKRHLGKMTEIQETVYEKNTTMSKYYYDILTFANFMVYKREICNWMIALTNGGNYDKINIVELVKFFEIPKDAFQRFINEYDMQLYTHYDVDTIYSGDSKRIAEHYAKENEAAHSKLIKPGIKLPEVTIDPNVYYPAVVEEIPAEPMKLNLRKAPNKYRPAYYAIYVEFADLVGVEEYMDWLMSRTEEEKLNECIALSFIKHFNISKEDFKKANDEHLARELEFGNTIDYRSEDYPVDLLYTFDSEKINEFFLWENSIYEEFEQQRQDEIDAAYEQAYNFFLSDGYILEP